MVLRILIGVLSTIIITPLLLIRTNGRLLLLGHHLNFLLLYVVAYRLNLIAKMVHVS